LNLSGWHEELMELSLHMAVELWRFGCNSDKMSCFCWARAEFREVVNKQVANERHQASKIRADLTQRAFSWHQPSF
jgi:hypothetical protein